jgi:poly(A) polymerase
MESCGRLDPQPWMTAPETRAVIAALTADGAEVRFVGGCVRDAVIGRPVSDIDIATHDAPERVMALLAKAGITAVPTGLQHGTVTAVTGKAHFEITTLRRDVETFGRRAAVAFTNDWTEDAARRDLTINALFCAPDGRLFDPFGGVADLRARRVRFVGDAETRIREDVLRLLRFFRFYAHYGAPPPDAEALAATRALAPLLPTLSGERVRAETLKLLLAPDPASVVTLMRDQNVLAHFLPEGSNLARLAALVTVEGIAPAQAVPQADAIRRLAALVDGGAPAARAVAQRLRLSNDERDRLVALCGGPWPMVDLDRAARRRLLYELGRDRFRDAALIAWAGAVAQAPAVERRESEDWRDLLAVAAADPPSFPLRGRDALALGLAPGPEIGRLIAAVERWWIDGDFRADRAACLARLAELSGSPPS